MQLPSSVSTGKCIAFFRVPTCLLRQALPEVIEVRVSSELMRARIREFFYGVSTPLPNFLLLGDARGPRPIPCTPSPSYVRLSTASFLCGGRSIRLSVPTAFRPLSTLLLVRFSLYRFPIYDERLLPRFPLRSGLSWPLRKRLFLLQRANPKSTLPIRGSK